jgi:RepB DNA-primase from phage plasmid/CHC2 zinc finger
MSDWSRSSGMDETADSSSPLNAAAETLLGIIAGTDTDSFYEIRYGWTPTRPLWGAVNEERSAVAGRIAELARRPRTNVWIGAAPRSAKVPGRATIKRVWCLWADIDTEKQPDAMRRLEAFPHIPTMVVLSGSPGHAHAWWSLIDPVRPDVATRALARLAFHLGADKGATDLARVMRVPGTTHYKHGRTAPVEMAYHDPRAYSVRQLVGSLPDPQPSPPRRATRTRDDGDPLRSVGTDEYVRRLTGLEPNARHKIRCPFHGNGAERTPSLHLYDNATWTCFACKKGGDIYNFAAWLWLGQRNASGAGFRQLQARLLREMGNQPTEGI